MPGTSNCSIKLGSTPHSEEEIAGFMFQVPPQEEKTKLYFHICQLVVFIPLIAFINPSYKWKLKTRSENQSLRAKSGPSFVYENKFYQNTHTQESESTIYILRKMEVEKEQFQNLKKGHEVMWLWWPTKVNAFS